MRPKTYCPYCMQEIREGATRCPECGEWLPAGHRTPYRQKKLSERYKSSDTLTGEKTAGADIRKAMQTEPENIIPPGIRLKGNCTGSAGHSKISHIKSLLGLSIIVLLIILLIHYCN